MATEQFDAVLAEARKILEVESAESVADRLSAAHAAEVGERDAEIARIHALHNSVRSRLDEVQAAYLDYRARAEAAEADMKSNINQLRILANSWLFDDGYKTDNPIIDNPTQYRATAKKECARALITLLNSCLESSNVKG